MNLTLSSFIAKTTLFCPLIALTYDDLLKQQNSITSTNSMSRFGHRHADSQSTSSPPPAEQTRLGQEWPTQHVLSTCGENKKSVWRVHYEDIDQGSFF